MWKVVGTKLDVKLQNIDSGMYMLWEEENAYKGPTTLSNALNPVALYLHAPNSNVGKQNTFSLDVYKTRQETHYICVEKRYGRWTIKCVCWNIIHLWSRAHRNEDKR